MGLLKMFRHSHFDQDFDRLLSLFLKIFLSTWIVFELATLGGDPIIITYIFVGVAILSSPGGSKRHGFIFARGHPVVIEILNQSFVAGYR